jgi:hypothetical protein
MPPDRVVNRGMGIRIIDNVPQARQHLQDAIDAAFKKIQQIGSSNSLNPKRIDSICPDLSVSVPRR